MSTSSETAKVVLYDIKKKSLGVAYLLYLFLGSISAHRFYTGNAFTAVLQIGLLLFAVIFFFAVPPIGGIIFIIWAIWIFLDIFLTARNVQNKNSKIAKEVGVI